MSTNPHDHRSESGLSARSAARALRHPPGLYVLAFTEMWERFSFYLVAGLLQLYLTDAETGGLGWSGPAAASLVGSYLGLVYFTPFLGGIAADRWLGHRRAVHAGGAFFVLGHALMAVPGQAMLFVALACLIVGNGLFKPNVSALVGRLYAADSPLRDRAYTIFYLGINVGAFACNFVAAIVRNLFGWHWAFATAGVGMAIGMATFFLGRAHVLPADSTRAERAARRSGSLRPLFVECLVPALLAAVVGYVFTPLRALNLTAIHGAFLFACVPVAVYFVRAWRGVAEPVARGRVGALLVVFAVLVAFWTVFHQNTTALTSWANARTDRRPGAALERVIALAPELAEVAPLDYFANAGPDVPRPALRVVSDEEHAELERAHRLGGESGEPLAVTAAMRVRAFARANASTPVLAPGERLRLVNTEVFQSLNSGFVLLLAPAMLALWSALSRRGREPSVPVKLALGMVLTGLSAVVMVFAARAAGGPEPGKVGAQWLVATYGVITLGELCLSPIGLSLVSKHAPEGMTGLLMGGWFLSTSIGSKLSGMFGELYHSLAPTTFFALDAACALGAAVVIVALLPYLRRHLAAPSDGARARPGEVAPPARASADAAHGKAASWSPAEGGQG